MPWHGVATDTGRPAQSSAILYRCTHAPSTPCNSFPCRDYRPETGTPLEESSVTSVACEIVTEVQRDRLVKLVFDLMNVLPPVVHEVLEQVRAGPDLGAGHVTGQQTTPKFSKERGNDEVWGSNRPSAPTSRARTAADLVLRGA